MTRKPPKLTGRRERAKKNPAEIKGYSAGRSLCVEHKKAEWMGFEPVRKNRETRIDTGFLKCRVRFRVKNYSFPLNSTTLPTIMTGRFFTSS